MISFLKYYQKEKRCKKIQKGVIKRKGYQSKKINYSLKFCIAIVINKETESPSYQKM